MQAQQRITGQVTAAGTGEPIPGVQIVVQGTGIGVVTNAEGRYVITPRAPTGTLIFTALGYGTKSLPFDGQTVVNAQLGVTAMALQEIVVMGYGQKTRANVTEAIATVSSKQLMRVPVASPEAAIEGRASGIQITPESGLPGAPVSVRIRGVGTVGNTQPLFVIDGVIMSNAVRSSISPR